MLLGAFKKEKIANSMHTTAASPFPHLSAIFAVIKPHHTHELNVNISNNDDEKKDTSKSINSTKR